MSIKSFFITVSTLIVICAVVYFTDKKYNNNNTNSDSDKSGLIERWHRLEDTVFYSKIDITKNDSVLFERKYLINNGDSSFVFDNRKIYLFEDTSKCAKFTGMQQYFDEHLPSVAFDIEITLWTTAIVGKEGQLEHIGIMQEPSRYSFILATVSTVENMPNWSPAHIGDEKVASLVMFPVWHKVK